MINLNPSLSLIIPTLLILHCTIFHLFLNHLCSLQNIFDNKTFSPQTFQKCVMSSIFFFFFLIFKPFPDGVYLFKTMETWVREICQICMKNSELICSKSTKAVNNIKDVVLVSLMSTSGVLVLRTRLKMYVGAFFAIQGTKAKIFNKFSNGF